MINHFKYLLLILFSSFSFATTIHVATTGSDDAGDGTESNPYATIQKGVDISVEGDTVLVHPGTYGHVSNVNSIYLISAQGPNQTVIDANLQNTAIHVNNNQGTPVSIFISGFTITGGICSGNEDNIGSTYVGGGISGGGDTFSFSNVHISNMIFYGNEIDINLRYGTNTPIGTAVISNSTFIVDRNHPTIETLNHPTTVNNCIFIDQGEGSSDISFTENESLTISNSLFFPNLNNLGAYIDGGVNIVANPVFCDPDIRDYSLAANSPAIGVGTDGSNIGALGVGCDAISLSLTINEIMNNPSAVSDSDGEWFEIYNNGDVSHDLNGWTIKDNGSDSHVISSSLVINPGEFKVLSNNSNQSTNGGLVVDYQYNGITLANGDDELVLIDPNGTVFDSVAYDGGPEFPDLNGASMGVIDAETDNNLGSNWQASTTAYGDSDLGTPGLPNFSSDIDVELTTIDFDTVLVGESLDKVLTISNTGNTTLVIDSVYTSSGAFTLPFTETSVETSLELTITFTPSAYGIVEDTLVLKTNDPDEGHVEIPLIGLGYVPSPNIVLETTSIDFGTVMDGLTETIEIHVANDGDAALSLSSVYIEGSANFTILNFSASIAETDTGSIDIQFSPDDETSFSGTLYIVSNDPDTDTLMVALSGIGGEQAPIMVLSDDELYFGTVQAGTTVEREVIIYNEGMLDLEVEEITITGSDYYTTTFSDASVEPGDSVIVPFSFAPTEQVAEIIATATVSSNVGAQTVELQSGYFGPVWHVATTGSDETGDGSETTPFATIQKGFDMLATGDTVFISAGEYYEELEKNMCDYGPNNITIMGEGMSNTIIGSFFIFGNRDDCNSIVENSKINIENFKFEGTLGLFDIENINIKNVWSESLTNMFNFSNYNTNQVAQISNSIFQTTLSMGSINETHSQQINFNYCTFTSVTVNENTSSMGNFSISYYNSIFHNMNFTNDNFQADFNFCSLSSVEGIGNDVEGIGNIYGDDPLFCGPENGDYSLASNSPAIGAGENGTNIGALGVGCGPIYTGPVWHVATTGSDETGDGSEENPFATIQYGIDNIPENDSLLIHVGTYQENLFFDKSLALFSEDLQNTIIDGNGSQVANIDDYVSVIFDNLTFKNGGNCSMSYEEGIISGSGAVNINNCLILGTVYLHGDNSSSITNSTIYSTGCIYDAGYFYAAIYSCAGISVENSIVVSESGKPIDCMLVFPNVLNNIIYSFSDNIQDLYDESNLISNPLFCDIQNGDFRVAENSPSIGAGTGGTNIGALGAGCGEILSIDQTLLPEIFVLHQNYPNPFNPVTSLKYDLPEQALVTLSIFDLMGREVRTLINSEQTAGFKNIQWNATDNLGKSVPAGMYIYTIQAGEFRQTRKMVLLK